MFSSKSAARASDRVLIANAALHPSQSQTACGNISAQDEAVADRMPHVTVFAGLGTGMETFAGLGLLSRRPCSSKLGLSGTLHL